MNVVMTALAARPVKNRCFPAPTTATLAAPAVALPPWPSRPRALQTWTPPALRAKLQVSRTLLPPPRHDSIANLPPARNQAARPSSLLPTAIANDVFIRAIRAIRGQPPSGYIRVHPGTSGQIKNMNEAPKGKIGRLPKAIQEQVNRRLENGEKARTLVAWLNALPDLPTLRTFLHDVMAVRRGDHSATRLQVASERLADKRRETGGEL